MLHIHPPQLGAVTAARISTAVKKMAASEVFVSAEEIVNKVVKSKVWVFSVYISVSGHRSLLINNQMLLIFYQVFDANSKSILF